MTSWSPDYVMTILATERDVAILMGKKMHNIPPHLDPIAYPSDEIDQDLGALADSAKGAADRVGSAIDDALASISASNKRIARIESAAEARSAELVDLQLHLKTERARLSSAALTGFFNLVAKWHVKDEDARELLGGISSGAYSEWKKSPSRLLDVDQITRISFLIGVYKALHIIYGDKLADEWVSLANTNMIFAGLTPMQYMLTGDLTGMQTVRNLLDARLDVP